MDNNFFDKLDGLYGVGNQEEIEKFLLDSLDKARIENSLEEVSILNELGGFYRGRSLFYESLKAFGDAETAVIRFCGTQSNQYAMVLLNMAGTYRMMGDAKKALECFNVVKEIYDSLYIRGFEYASLLNNMALACQQVGNMEVARELLEQSLSMLENIDGSDIERATTLSNLGALMLEQDKREKAADFLKEALEIFAQDDFKENPHHGACLNAMAVLHFKNKDYSNAIEFFSRSSVITEKGFGRNVDFALNIENIGHVYEILGDRENAISSYNIALEILLSIPEMESKVQFLKRKIDSL